MVNKPPLYVKEREAKPHMPTTVIDITPTEAGVPATFRPVPYAELLRMLGGDERYFAPPRNIL